MCAFDDFVDLSIVVFSIAISNIKKRWITIDFDELWSEIVNWRKSDSCNDEQTRKTAVCWKNQGCWALTTFSTNIQRLWFGFDKSESNIRICGIKKVVSPQQSQFIQYTTILWVCSSLQESLFLQLTISLQSSSKSVIIDLFFMLLIAIENTTILKSHINPFTLPRHRLLKIGFSLLTRPNPSMQRHPFE